MRPVLLVLLPLSAGLLAGGVAGLVAGWPPVAAHGYFADGMYRLVALHVVEPLDRAMLRGGGVGLALGLFLVLLDRNRNGRPPRWLSRGGWPAGALTGIAIFGLAAVHGLVWAPPRAHRPNVLFILVDALRADRLGKLGTPAAGGPGSLTPNLDALADHSLFFTHAYSNAPKTVPSVASLFTSTLPVVHRVWEAPDGDGSEGLSYLPNRLLLATEVFKNHGYRTGMATTTGWITPEVNYDQGVDEYAVTERADEAVVTAAESFISRHTEGSFFLYVHLLDLHDYYHSDRLFAELPAGEDNMGISPALLELRGSGPSAIYRKLRVEPDRFTPADARFLERAYDRELGRTDALVGRLVGALERAGIRETTRVVFTADHGEQFLEHGRLVHGGNGLYEEVLRVPFFIAGGGDEKRRVVRDPIGSIDFFPTLLDLLGLPVPGVFEGESRVPGTKERGERGTGSVVATDGRTWKLVTGRWSYIFSRRYQRQELYDLDADPGESRNLAARRPGVARELGHRLAERIRRSRRHPYLREAEVERVEMTEDIEKTLRSLGYLD